MNWPPYGEQQRNKKIDDLIDLFTCPHCDKIDRLERHWYGLRVCDRCYARASAGERRLIDERKKP